MTKLIAASLELCVANAPTFGRKGGLINWCYAEAVDAPFSEGPRF
jgi:hypothetical protein